MKKKKKLAIVISSVAVIALIGGTYAAFTASTSTTEQVSAASLGIELIQTGDTQNEAVKQIKDDSGVLGFSYQGAPGSEIQESLAVKTESDSIPSYIRVTVNRSWIDSYGEKVFDSEVDPKEIGIITKNQNNWIIMEDQEDSEMIYFYYKPALGAGETTDNIIDSFTILKNAANSNSNAYANLSAKLTFEVDAVQEIAAKEAMEAEWGVVAELDSNGNLTSVTEQ